MSNRLVSTGESFGNQRSVRAVVVSEVAGKFKNVGTVLAFFS